MWDYRPLEYEGYVYPMWANVLGWCIAGSSIAMIPAVALYKIATTPGSFCEVIDYSDEIVPIVHCLCFCSQRMKILTTPQNPHPRENIAAELNNPTERPSTLLIIDSDTCKTSNVERSTYV